jgi:hypothetical protein
MARPNPEGWKGGSEDFDCLWNAYGHRAENVGLHLPEDEDGDDTNWRNVGRHADYETWFGGA